MKTDFTFQDIFEAVEIAKYGEPTGFLAADMENLRDIHINDNNYTAKYTDTLVDGYYDECTFNGVIVDDKLILKSLESLRYDSNGELRYKFLINEKGMCPYWEEVGYVTDLRRQLHNGYVDRKLIFTDKYREKYHTKLYGLDILEFEIIKYYKNSVRRTQLPHR